VLAIPVFDCPSARWKVEGSIDGDEIGVGTPDMGDDFLVRMDRLALDDAIAPERADSCVSCGTSCEVDADDCWRVSNPGLRNQMR